MILVLYLLLKQHFKKSAQSIKYSVASQKPCREKDPFGPCQFSQNPLGLPVKIVVVADRKRVVRQPTPFSMATKRYRSSQTEFFYIFPYGK